MYTGLEAVYLHLDFSKGDKVGCINYRGTSFIDITPKIPTAMLVNRFLYAYNSRTRPKQERFRSKIGYSDIQMKTNSEAH